MAANAKISASLYLTRCRPVYLYLYPKLYGVVYQDTAIFTLPYVSDAL
jgi:hypothetical protein